MKTWRFGCPALAIFQALHDSRHPYAAPVLCAAHLENKVRFVAAVSRIDRGHPMFTQPSSISGLILNSIGKWAQANLTPGTVVTCDDLGCLAAADAKCVQVPVTVGTLKPRDLPEFKRINTVPGNLMTTLAGSFHALKYRRYAGH